MAPLPRLSQETSHVRTHPARARPPRRLRPGRLEAYDPVIDGFGDLALSRYWLRVDFAPGPGGRPMRPELVRNTAVLRRDAGDGWLIVHLHEDVRPPGGVPGTGG